jgi:beta-lactam-binding protein with PASTA domain
MYLRPLSIVVFCLASLTVSLVPAADAEQATDFRGAPSLKNRKAEEAVQVARLAGFDLKVGKFYIAPQHWRDDIRPGAVLMQSPQPGSALLPGSLMAGWVFEKSGADRPIIQTPDVRRLSLSAASKVLAEAKLPLLNDTSIDDQIVVDQYPRPGQTVYEGTSVFVVAKKKSDGD